MEGRNGEVFGGRGGKGGRRGRSPIGFRTPRHGRRGDECGCGKEQDAGDDATKEELWHTAEETLLKLKSGPERVRKVIMGTKLPLPSLVNS